MKFFTLPKKAARLIVLQRIELLSPFLAKIRKLFGRYLFSNLITKYFLNQNLVGRKYYETMLNEFSTIERFIGPNDKFFLSILGEEIGLLFQLADDFLDKKGSKNLVGKPVKKDNKKGKSTLLNLIGEKKAYLYANNLKRKILRKLKKHGKKANELVKTIEFILERKF